ncbi:MAG: hypothetical protein NWE83_12160 [Candidatus Bathyarchaeota archaeon]|nr:hypothetical protein [Candidatus Bathyarchaeota archaeon]
MVESDENRVEEDLLRSALENHLDYLVEDPFRVLGEEITSYVNKGTVYESWSRAIPAFYGRAGANNLKVLLNLALKGAMTKYDITKAVHNVNKLSTLSLYSTIKRRVDDLYKKEYITICKKEFASRKPVEMNIYSLTVKGILAALASQRVRDHLEDLLQAHRTAFHNERLRKLLRSLLTRGIPCFADWYIGTQYRCLLDLPPTLDTVALHSIETAMYRSLLRGILDIYIPLSQHRAPAWVSTLNPQQQKEALVGFLDVAIMKAIAEATDHHIEYLRNSIQTYTQLKTWLLQSAYDVQS